MNFIFYGDSVKLITTLDLSHTEKRKLQPRQHHVLCRPSACPRRWLSRSPDVALQVCNHLPPSRCPFGSALYHAGFCIGAAGVSARVSFASSLPGSKQAAESHTS